MADFELSPQTVLRLSQRALEILRPQIKPKSLREGAKVILNGDGEIEVTFEHFWAALYHDGHGPSLARRGRYLVWFRVPERDPRYTKGYPPRTKNEIRRLTKEEFRQAKDAGDIVISRISRGWKGDPFLDRFLELGDTKFEAILDDEVQALVDEILPSQDF
jgi:hypothetical protein